MKNFKKKRLFILCLLLMLSITLAACGKQDSENADSKTNTIEGKEAGEQPKEVEAVTGGQIAHAFGVIIARTVKETKLDFNAEELLKGYQDAMAENFDQAKFSEAEMVLQRALQEARMKMMAEKLEASNKFLEENKTKDGIKTTESGLQYRILKAGDQSQKPKAGDSVKVKYIGKLTDGTVFDQNLESKELQSINIERVIPGWKEGLQLMSKGAKFQFFIPPNLAYGEQGINQGGNVIIPPNAVLEFEVELISIERPSDKKDSKDN